MSNSVSRQAKQLARNKNQIVSQFYSEIRYGILPPPDELEKYEKLCPGITKILLEQFQAQSNHRIKIETMAVESGIRNSRLGQVLGFIISMAVIIGGFILIFLDKNIIGISAIIGALASLAGVFIYGTKSKREERIRKSSRNP